MDNEARVDSGRCFTHTQDIGTECNSLRTRSHETLRIWCTSARFVLDYACHLKTDDVVHGEEMISMTIVPRQATVVRCGYRILGHARARAGKAGRACAACAACALLKAEHTH